jgi:beta-1,4-mannosyl-glycoprotein beta-1,4-N-acetylglucosaminyltransferase
MTSDLDEIPNPKAVAWLKENFNPDALYAFEQRMHQYYLNVVNVDEPWAGTRACSMLNYQKIDAETLRHSQQACMTLENAGWHWSFLGGEEAINKKITSYAHEEYDNEETLSQVKTRMMNLEDVFNRGFRLEKVEMDDSYPEYILNNLDKYSHLIYE